MRFRCAVMNLGSAWSERSNSWRASSTRPSSHRISPRPLWASAPSGCASKCLVEPRERLLGATTVRSFHRLIQTVPVAIDVLHDPVLEGGWGGTPARNFVAS